MVLPVVDFSEQGTTNVLPSLKLVSLTVVQSLLSMEPWAVAKKL